MDMTGDKDERPGTVSAETPGEMPVYDARVLTRGGQLAGILLDDQLYTLRITKAGKLILTK